MVFKSIKEAKIPFPSQHQPIKLQSNRLLPNSRVFEHQSTRKPSQTSPNIPFTQHHAFQSRSPLSALLTTGINCRGSALCSRAAKTKSSKSSATPSGPRTKTPRPVNQPGEHIIKPTRSPSKPTPSSFSLSGDLNNPSRFPQHTALTLEPIRPLTSMGAAPAEACLLMRAAMIRPRAFSSSKISVVMGLASRTLAVMSSDRKYGSCAVSRETDGDRADMGSSASIRGTIRACYYRF